MRDRQSLPGAGFQIGNLIYHHGKSDGIQGFQFGNQRLATAVHLTFELRGRMQIQIQIK